MKTYPARVWKEENGTWSVEFPDLPGCYSSADTLEAAKACAKEALDAYLESLDSRSLSIPEPSSMEGPDLYEVQPALQAAFAITLKHERRKRGWTQKEAARRMGVAWAAYQRIENPRRTNPTLSTIAKLQELLGRDFLDLE